MGHNSKDRFDTIFRVIKKRRKRGATRRSIVAWLQSLKGDESIINAVIDALIRGVLEAK